MLRKIKSSLVISPFFPRKLESLSIFAAILLGSILPRLYLAGGLPATDEGYYAFHSQIMHHSLASKHGLPDAGNLMLYPMFFSWVFAFDVNHLIILRLGDLLVNTLLGWTLFKALKRECGNVFVSSTLTFVFLFTLNQSIFIQNGFKNSIHAALVPMLIAICAAQKRPLPRWDLIGGLITIMLLLRETLIPFAALAFVSALLLGGRKGLFKFLTGDAIAAALILTAIVLARGGLSGLIQSYVDLQPGYAAVADQRTEHFLKNGLLSVKESTHALYIGAAAGIALIYSFFQKSLKPLHRRLAFWGALTALSLVEPSVKIGFPYHFSLSLIGLAGLCALAWRSVTGKPIQIAFAIALGVLTIDLLSKKVSPIVKASRESLVTLKASTKNQWAPEKINGSNYLIAMDKILSTLPQAGTLSVAGVMLTLYPLTGKIPPSYALSNLTSLIAKLNFSSDKLREMLVKCSPDIVFTTSRTDLPGGPQILKAVEDSGLYTLVDTVPVTNHVNYGRFGGKIFKANRASASDQMGCPKP